MHRIKKIILNIPHSSDRLLPLLPDAAWAGGLNNSDLLPLGSGWTNPKGHSEGGASLDRLVHGFISRLSSELIPDSLIIDCHSFPSDLADIDICIGYNDDASRPDQEMIDSVARLFDGAGFKVGLNNPYSNSITPKKPIDYKSLMIEVNKRCYMNERTLARTVGYNIISGLVNNLYHDVLNINA